MLFAILQKYDFSSKSQPPCALLFCFVCCLRYCKSTIFQANHNQKYCVARQWTVVCDTAKVRFFKQITTSLNGMSIWPSLFAILQKYDFSSKSTIFQANHNVKLGRKLSFSVVCDTAKVRFFKQITTHPLVGHQS